MICCTTFVVTSGRTEGRGGVDSVSKCDIEKCKCLAHPMKWQFRVDSTCHCSCKIYTYKAYLIIVSLSLPLSPSPPLLAAPTWTHCSSSWHARYPAFASRLNTDPQVCWSWWRPPVPVTIGASMVSRTAERELTRSHGTAPYYDPTLQRVSRPRSTSRRWPMREKMDALISPPMQSRWTSTSRTFRWASITLPMATLLFVSQRES